MSGTASATAKEHSKIQEQLNEWRENAKHLYERLDTVSLDWPSLTAQWCLDDFEGQRAMVATYSLGADADKIREVEIDTEKLRPDQHQLRSWLAPVVEETEKIPDVTGEIQKLRQCPSDSGLFAAFAANSGNVYIFNKSDQTATKTLKGHSACGFGLAWDPSSKKRLISGADDGKIILWDLEQSSGAPVRIHETGSIANEITWDHDGEVVVALESGNVLVLSPTLDVLAELKCHDEGVNSAALSPFAPHLLATGGADNRLKLWDTRRPGEAPLYENFAHEGKINCIRWSPHVDGVLASAGMDCIVYIWDIRNIGKDQPHEDVEDGAAELLFKHNGHLNGDQVQDIDWHPTIEMLLLSCDGRNVLMSWKPNGDALEKPEAPAFPSFLI